MSSKFGDILRNAKKGPEPEQTPAKSEPVPAPVPSPAPIEPTPERRPGRPPGKRSDPAFEQVTAYIPGKLYRRVRIALLEDAKDQEFSELVAELLAGWLGSRQSE